MIHQQIVKIVRNPEIAKKKMFYRRFSTCGVGQVKPRLTKVNGSEAPLVRHLVKSKKYKNGLSGLKKKFE